MAEKLLILQCINNKKKLKKQATKQKCSECFVLFFKNCNIFGFTFPVIIPLQITTSDQTYKTKRSLSIHHREMIITGEHLFYTIIFFKVSVIAFQGLRNSFLIRKSLQKATGQCFMYTTCIKFYNTGKNKDRHKLVWNKVGWINIVQTRQKCKMYE